MTLRPTAAIIAKRSAIHNQPSPTPDHQNHSSPEHSSHESQKRAALRPSQEEEFALAMLQWLSSRQQALRLQ
jgi:hypothetical protein